MDIGEVNALGRAEFVTRLGGVFESSPWVAEAVVDERPFDDRDALRSAMVRAVDSAPQDRQLALIRAHPDLAGRAAIAGELTPESTQEQAAAGLDRLTPDQHERLLALNDAYRERFGFPYVVCAREHSAETIIADAARRIEHEPDDERETALLEIAKIAGLRIEDLT